MVADVYGPVHGSAGCARNRVGDGQHTSDMKLFPATEPFQSVAMDLLGPLPTSENGRTMILVICDRLPKRVRAIPLKGATALEVASAFIDDLVAANGIPDSTLTDNGPQFAAVFFQGVMGWLGIATNYISPYNPQTNGRCPRSRVSASKHLVLGIFLLTSIIIVDRQTDHGRT